MKLLTTLMDFVRFFTARLKVYVGRASAYNSIINSGMLLFILLASLKNLGMGEFPIAKYGIPIFLASMGLAMTIGYLDVKLGLYEAEQKYTSSRNPQLIEILERVKKIEEKLK